MDDRAKQTFEAYKQTAASYKELEATLQRQLQALKAVAGSTFQVDNQYYQIRQRKGVLYFCELKSAPQGRPKGSRDKHVQAALDAKLEVSPAVEDGDEPPAGESPKELISAPLEATNVEGTCVDPVTPNEPSSVPAAPTQP